MRLILMLTLGLAAAQSGCYRDTSGGSFPPALRDGQELYRAAKYDLAQEKLRQVLRSPLRRDRVWAMQARYYFARCDQLAGRSAAALVAFNDILSALPRREFQILARAARADLYLETGQYARAVSDYRRARGVFERSNALPSTQEVSRAKLLFGEGRALLAAGRRKQAAVIFRIYLADYPADAHGVKTWLRTTEYRRQTISFYVRTGGLHRVKPHADRLASKVRAAGFPDVSVQKTTSAHGYVYAVKVGQLDTRQGAHALRTRLQAAGFTSLQVRP
jgi:tetratricopeptide (TPR) repeat protein